MAEYKFPTEVVELPSKGYFYMDGHPLSTGKVEIKYMTAKEEDILTSRSLLKKGVALDRVIENLIVDKSVDPDSLLIGDRNAIIIATRVSGYGADYVTKITCPQCSETQEYAFDLNNASIYGGDDIDVLDIADHEDGTFTSTLPKTNLNVRFRLLNGYDEKTIAKSAQSERKRNNLEKNITRQLSRLIVSVNDDETKDTINYVVENVPSMDSRHLREAYKLAAPNIDLTQIFTCNECSYEQDMEVPLTADFFWPDR